MAMAMARIKVVLLLKDEEQVNKKLLEQEQVKKEKGKEKLKQKEDEEKALVEVKFSMRKLIKDSALKNNLEVDIIELHRVTDLEQIADVRGILFVAAEQIFDNDLILYLERVTEFVWIPFILFSSNSECSKLECLYKGNKNLDMKMKVIERGYIGEFMKNYSKLCHSYNVKKKKGDDQVVEGGLGQEVKVHVGQEEVQIQNDHDQIVEGGLGQEVKVHVGQEEVQIQNGHDLIVEGEAGHEGHVEAQLPWPIKLKKRWERNWLKLKKRWEKDWIQSLE